MSTIPTSNDKTPPGEVAERITSTQPAIAAGLLLILSMVLNAPRAPMAAVIASALVAVAVIPTGIYALRKLRGAPRTGVFRFFLIATMVLGGFFAVSTLIQLLAFSTTSAYLECVSTALTDAGRIACEKDMTSSLLRQLFGG